MCTRSVYDLLRHLLHHFPCETKTLPSFSMSFMMSKNLGIIIGMKFPACRVLHKVHREQNAGSILPIVHSSLDEYIAPQISAKMIAEWAAGVWSQAAGQRRGGREGRPRSVRHFSLPLSLSSLTSPPLSISILHMWNSLTLFLPFHQFPSSPKLSPTAHIVSTPARAAAPAIPRRIRALTRPAGPRDTPSHRPARLPKRPRRRETALRLRHHLRRPRLPPRRSALRATASAAHLLSSQRRRPRISQLAGPPAASQRGIGRASRGKQSGSPSREAAAREARQEARVLSPPMRCASLAPLSLA